MSPFAATPQSDCQNTSVFGPAPSDAWSGKQLGGMSKKKTEMTEASKAVIERKYKAL